MISEKRGQYLEQESEKRVIFGSQLSEKGVQNLGLWTSLRVIYVLECTCRDPVLTEGSPIPSEQASVWTSTTDNLSKSLHLPLNTSKNLCHQRLSALNSLLSNDFAPGENSIFICLRICHIKVRPLYTTLEAQFSLPASACK